MNDEEKAVLESFETWWDSHGQFCRSGGGEYEKVFAYAAWEYIRDQEAVKVALLVGTIQYILPTLHADPRCPSEITDRLEQVISGTKSDAEAFIREKQAEALEKLAERFFQIADENDPVKFHHEALRMAEEFRSSVNKER